MPRGHRTDDGIKPCKAKPGNCPLKQEDGSAAKHYNSIEEGQKDYEKEMAEKNPMQGIKKNRVKNAKKLVESNGQMVIKGEVSSSDFVKGFSIKEGINGYYDGSWKNLQNLVKEHFDDNEPGIGSENGDVLLINVPNDNFYTSIVEVDDSNKHLVEEIEHIRGEGEKPVYMKVIKGMEKPPAKDTQIVVYRADTLAQDNDRSTDAEWEIVSVNAQIERNTPMHPTTMIRNAEHEEGGTERTYTDKEWADAYAYWDNHAYIETGAENSGE